MNSKVLVPIKGKIQNDRRKNSKWGAHTVFADKVCVKINSILGVCKPLINKLIPSKNNRISPGIHCLLKWHRHYIVML